MALRYAVATGNWSNTSTWNGGTLPTLGDDVYANGFTVTIDQDINVKKISTKASSPAVAGGLFLIPSPTTSMRNVVSDIEAGTTNCLRIDEISSASQRTNITGNIYGGESTNAYGVFLNGTSNSQAHEPMIIGNIYGGTASGTHGLSGRGDRGYRPTVYGNVFAGTAGKGMGFTSNTGYNSAMISTIYGNITANGDMGYTAVGTLYVYGNVIASNNTFGAQSVTAYVSGNITNVAGNWGIYSTKMFVHTNQSLQLTLNEQTTNNDITLYSLNSFVGIPSGSDVRSGIIYGPSNSLTGSLAVPPSGSVALGVPVDDGLGTAMISIQDMGTLLASYVV